MNLPGISGWFAEPWGSAFFMPADRAQRLRKAKFSEVKIERMNPNDYCTETTAEPRAD